MKTEEYVTVDGKKYCVDLIEQDGVEVKALFLAFLSVKDMADIQGLDAITGLQELNLEYNQITEVKGLESLVKLQSISFRFNEIAEIKGLETLANLRDIEISFVIFRGV